MPKDELCPVCKEFPAKIKCSSCARKVCEHCFYKKLKICVECRDEAQLHTGEEEVI